MDTCIQENWIFGEHITAYKVRTEKKIKDLPKISKPDDIIPILDRLYEHDHFDQEKFYVIYCNIANRVLSIKLISSGGLVGTVVDPSIIFKNAILLGSLNLILAHNHPSCSHVPSKQDIDITEQIISCAKLFNMIVLDHIIYAGKNEQYCSFANNGLL